jgi:hypothetical protein
MLLKQKLVEAGNDVSIAFVSCDDKAKVRTAFELRMYSLAE